MFCNIKKIFILLVTITACLFITTGCSGGNEVQSSLAENIAVDGNQSEWGGYLNYYEDELVSAGFKNDSKNLYLCLVTQNQSLKRMIMQSGLVVWFEPENGKKIGLRFPISGEFGPSVRSARPALDNNDDKRPGSNQEDLHKKLGEFFERQIQLSIINEDKYPLYQLESDTSNIEVKMKLNNYTLVYEAKMPLHTNSSAEYFVEAAPGEQIKVVIETPSMKNTESVPDEGFSDMNSPSGMGGSGGSMGERMRRPVGGMLPGGMGQFQKGVLEMTFKVLLVPVV